jgi:hypothetical protein
VKESLIDGVNTYSCMLLNWKTIRKRGSHIQEIKVQI